MVYLKATQKIIVSLLVFILLFIFNIQTNYATNKDNAEIIKNGDFSLSDTKKGKWTGKGAKAWDIWIPSQFTKVKDYKILVNDQDQLEIVSEKENFRVGIFQTVKLVKGKKYKLQLKLETVDKKGTTKVRINYGSNKTYDIPKSNFGNTAQRNIDHDFVAEYDGNAKVEIFYETGTGKMLIDDVSLKEVIATSDNNSSSNQTVSPLKPSTDQKDDNLKTKPETNQGDSSNQKLNIQKDEAGKAGSDQKNDQEKLNDSKCGLIKNCDFSQTSAQTGDFTGSVPTGWTAYIPDKDKNIGYKQKAYKVEVNEASKLKISASKEFRMAVVQKNIKVEPNKFYELGYKVATKDKDGSTRIRIVEHLNSSSEPKKYLIYGPNHFSTMAEKSFTKSYIPDQKVTHIDLEIWFEPKTGTVIYDDVYLKEVEKPDLNKDLKQEDHINLSVGKKYLVRDLEAQYQVADKSIASFDKHIITALKAGVTTVTVTKKSGETSTLKLTVTPKEVNDFEAKLALWQESIIANDYYDDSNPYMLNLKNQLDQEAKKIMGSLAEKEDYRRFFKDIESYKLSKALTESYRRLELLAKQITQPKSAYFQDYQAIKTVLTGMDWLYKTQYNTKTTISDNWWDYEIGTPRSINNILTLMRPYFSQAQIKQYTDPINILVPDPFKFRVTLGNPFDALGGNLVDMARVKMISAFLRNDALGYEQALLALKKIYVQRQYKDTIPCEAGKCEGFYQDGSYVDHTNVAYTGAYGSVVLDGLSQLFPLIVDQTETDDLTTLLKIIDKSFKPIIYRGQLMDMLRGRSISRSSSQTHMAASEVIRGVLRIAYAHKDLNIQKQLKTLVKTWIDQDDFYKIEQGLKTYKDISLIDKLKNDPTITAHNETSLNVFNNMNKVIYQNSDKGFALGLSMHSDTIKNYEYMNKENAKGWFTSDGTIYLYNGDNAHYSNDYWPTIDSYKLPSTTELTTKLNEDPTRKNNDPTSYEVLLKSQFSGASKLNERFGLAAMDFNNFNNLLKVKKAWFIFDDKVVFLGSDLVNNSQDEAYTIIENRKINKNENYQILADDKVVTNLENQKVKKLFLENNLKQRNIGYLFLDDTAINLKKEMRQGKWSDLKFGEKSDVKTNEFILVETKHTTNKHYAYVMYPNIDRASFNKAGQDVEVLNNNNGLQVVKDVKNKVFGVVIYDHQTYKLDYNITLKGQGLYLVKITDDKYLISVYNPVTKTFDENSIETSLVKKITKRADYENHSTILEVSKSQKDNSASQSNPTNHQSNPILPKQEPKPEVKPQPQPENNNASVTKQTPVLQANTNLNIIIDNNQSLQVKTSADINTFKEVRVDDKVIDKTNYDLKEGSTIVTLKASYLNTLAEGTHKLEIVSNESNTYKAHTVTVLFTIQKPKQTVTHNPNWQQDLRKHNEFISKHNKETNKTLPNTGHINNHSILLASTLLTLVAYRLYKKED